MIFIEMAFEPGCRPGVSRAAEMCNAELGGNEAVFGGITR